MNVNDISTGFDLDFVETLYAPEAKMQKTSEAEQHQETQRLRLAYANLLNTAEGKLVLNDLLNQTGVFDTCFTGNSSTFFNEGRRYVGVYVYRRLMIADKHALQKLADYAYDLKMGKEIKIKSKAKK